MIEVKERWVHECAEPIARVEAHARVSYPDEQQLRRLLNKFYATPREFSRVAMEVVGAAILFRPIKNCKPAPSNADMQALLMAMNLWEITQPAVPKGRLQAKIKAVTRQNHLV